MPSVLCAALAVAIAAGPAQRTRAHPVAGRRAEIVRTASRPRGGNTLDDARKLLAQVKRDPARRRYRHHWERAIAALENAARGRDRAPALLDAARARYALYRFSQVDSDREAALALARKAQGAGSREAETFARAIRKEMGDSRDARRRATAAVARVATPPGAQAPQPPAESRAASAETGGAAASEDASAEEAPTDPALQEALEHADDTAEEDAKAPARVSEVKTWSNGDYTRVAVYLSREVGFTREEIPASDGHPRRLALDLKPALLGRGLAHEVRDALVQRVRAAQRDPDTVRVVLDLAGRDDLTIFSLRDPPRLIIDVGVREALRESAAQAQHAVPHEDEGELATRRPVRRIIIDAGHGGHDTGAIGPTHVREKDVTLAMARRLARRLEARGFEVVLTRGDDRYVALEERTAIANARHGDLFVSLHANAHPHRDRRGVETYVLNVADDRYAARLAARENGALRDAPSDGPEVRRILLDLDAKASAEASRRFAQLVQHEICSGIRGHVGEVRDLGVKSALFYVLLGARMPAVLVETSFISNRVEERRLDSARFRDEVASAVTRAVERFAAREARVASAR